MTSSPFEHIARSLTAPQVRTWQTQADAIETGISRTERIRRLLKSTGTAMTDAEIAWDMGDHFPNFGAHLVWLLLKNDIRKGRVRMIRHGLYRWNDEYDAAQAEAIRAAVKLLTAHGYKIEAPAA